MSKVLVLDNGSYNIKIGYASEDNPQPYHIPNCITHGRNKKSYVGSQFSTCTDFSGLMFQRPHDKGQLVDWRLEYAIWNYTFFGYDSPIQVDPSDSSLILTETALSLPAVSANTDQMVLEEYGFSEYYRCTPGSLIPWNNFGKDLYQEETQNNSPLAECALVIDAGFNCTNVLPTILGEVYWPAVQQISVGGRLLTNYLRETVSFQQFNMMEETYLINKIKEQTCFIATDFEADLEKCMSFKKGTRSQRAENPYLISYALPETPGDIGHIIDATNTDGASFTQALRLSNERFTVPELLFAPHHVGLNQSGLPEAIYNSLQKVPPELQSLFASNIVLVGGSAKIPGFVDRLRSSLTPLLPDTVNLRVTMPKDPVTYAWKGGCQLGLQPDMLAKVHVTREEYMEYGEKICASKFNMKRMETEEHLSDSFSE